MLNTKLRVDVGKYDCTSLLGLALHSWLFFILISLPRSASGKMLSREIETVCMTQSLPLLFLWLLATLMCLLFCNSGVKVGVEAGSVSVLPQQGE